jgi:hypothetical protein
MLVCLQPRDRLIVSLQVKFLVILVLLRTPKDAVAHHCPAAVRQDCCKATCLRPSSAQHCFALGIEHAEHLERTHLSAYELSLPLQRQREPRSLASPHRQRHS